MTDRQERFLYALCVCVKTLTLGQGMRWTGINDSANFSKFVGPLIERDLVRTCRAFAKPIPEMKEPLLSVDAEGCVRVDCSMFSDPGTPGAGAMGEMSLDVEAGFPNVLALARNRWASFPASSVACYVATKRAGNLWGVRRTGQLAQPLQATHDLAVAEVCLRYLIELGHAENWRGEDAASATLEEFRPDAVIVDAQGLPQKALEIVGADYDEAKLKDIHQECNARGLGYELW